MVYCWIGDRPWLEELSIELIFIQVVIINGCGDPFVSFHNNY